MKEFDDVASREYGDISENENGVAEEALGSEQSTMSGPLTNQLLSSLS